MDNIYAKGETMQCIFMADLENVFQISEEEKVFKIFWIGVCLGLGIIDHNFYQQTN